MARETVTVNPDGSVDVQAEEPVIQPRRSRYQPTAPEVPGETRRKYESAGKKLFDAAKELLWGDDDDDVERAKKALEGMKR